MENAERECFVSIKPTELVPSENQDNVILWCVRLTVVAVKTTMLYFCIVFDIRVAVESIKVVYCCLGSVTIGSLCTVVELQNIS